MDSVATDDSRKPPSSERARWAANHPVIVGLGTGLLVAAGGVLLFDQLLTLAVIVSAAVGLAVWLGWRRGGRLRRIEERNHRLDVD